MRSLYWIVFVLAGCSAIDVSDDIGTFSGSVDAVEADFRTRLQPLIEEEDRSHREAAAERGDGWRLSSGCDDLVEGTRIASPTECFIRMRKFGDADPQVKRGARSAERKLGVLKVYLSALHALSSDEAETALNEGFSNALAGLEKLSDEAEFETALNLLAKLDRVQSDIKTIGNFAIKNARLRALRKLVAESQSDVETIVGEIRDIFRFIDLGGSIPGYPKILRFEGQIDPKYWDLYDAAQEANDAVSKARNTGARLAAFDQLEAAHKAFIEYEPRSAYGMLRAIATTHRALVARLDRNASIKEVFAFLRELDGLVSAAQEVVGVFEEDEG